MKYTLEGSNSAEIISPWGGELERTVASVDWAAGEVTTFFITALKILVWNWNVNCMMDVRMDMDYLAATCVCEYRHEL